METLAKVAVGHRANILVRAKTNASYSGGRLLAWIAAEAFAHQGHNVTFWGDTRPPFVDDFRHYPRHNHIRFHGGTREPDRQGTLYDLVVVVPHLGWPLSYYPEILGIAAAHRARVALLNFETPNWFNETAPESRDPRLWNGWREIAKHSDVVLSPTREGTRYAIAFYDDAPKSCRFVNVTPAINTLAADLVEGESRRQIICITRFTNADKHKGGSQLRDILGPHLSGYTLALIVGAGGISESDVQELRRTCTQFQISLKLLFGISDSEKFKEIKRSKLLVFLSVFEGFGYPPVEALYCNVPCVAYDLPVLREVVGSALTFVPLNDAEAFRKAIIQTLEDVSHPELRNVVASKVTLDSFGRGLDDVFSEVLNLPRRQFSSLDRLYWKCESYGLRAVGLAPRLARRVIRVVDEILANFRRTLPAGS